ncbi:WGR domain-containing protein [Roseibium salinum]|nr:WGR domain-containing protein [Roseibium salinum]
METHGHLTLLTRIEPRRNMARFYSLSIEPTFFSAALLSIGRGDVSARGGQSRLDYCLDFSAAQARKEQLTERKLKRGYTRK